MVTQLWGTMIFLQFFSNWSITHGLKIGFFSDEYTADISLKWFNYALSDLRPDCSKWFDPTEVNLYLVDKSWRRKYSAPRKIDEHCEALLDLQHQIDLHRLSILNWIHKITISFFSLKIWLEWSKTLTP